MAIKINFKTSRKKELKLKDLPIGQPFKNYMDDQVYIKTGVIEEEDATIEGDPIVECIILGSDSPKTCCSPHLVITPVDLDITVTSIFE